MKKSILFLLVVIMPLILLFSKGSFDKKEIFQTKGRNIKTYKENKYKVKLAGELIQKGMLYSKESYSKDDKGNVLEESSYTSGVESPDEKTIFTYDAAGKLTEKNLYKNGNFLYRKYSYKYNKNGKLSEELAKNLSGSIEEKLVFNYDGLNNLTSKMLFKNNKQFKIEEISYDNNGNKTEEYEYDEKGYLKYKFTFKYNKNNRRIEKCKYNADGGLIVKYTFNYNEKGDKSEEFEYNPDGTVKWKYKYLYDSKGNKIEEKEFMGEDKLRSKT
ncbi:MAG: hypothetical protein KA792_08290, partial [Bacteroidales bacterium]|nr:hypothetical protein [Bacteroidales bacterium]